MSSNPPPPSSDNFRPSVMRAASLQSYSYKTRAASQPAGERIPIPPATALGASPGRSSPIVGGERFGVIGGTRAPGRFAGALAAGTQTRANSFSAGESRDTRNTPLGRTLSSHTEEHPSRVSSTSPYPTFSPSDSPSGSPQPSHAQLPHSPPKAGANVSRSRSQSLAAGHRPDRGLLMPMTNLEQPFRTFDKGWDTSPPDAGNHSPFSRHPPSFGELANQPTPAQRFKPHDFTRGWGVPDSHALSSSVAHALGNVQTASGFEGGGKSGASSRRHSVSVVGGFGRRDFFEAGQGMSMMSPPGRSGSLHYTDAELLPDRLNNALSLEIDQSRRRGVEIEMAKSPQGRDIPLASSLPFDRPFGPLAHEGSYGLGTSPARGRLAGFQPADGRGQSGDSRDGSSSRSKFAFEGQPVGSPARQEVRPSPGRPPSGPGAIGGPAYDPRFQPPFGTGPGGMFRPPYPPGPASPMGQYQYARPNSGAYPFYPRPPAPMYPSHTPFSPPHQAPFSPAQSYAPSSYLAPSPTSSALPLPGSTSPSFSSLSLSDLGKGLPLTALPPSTPLYVVLFKAGRRDVYYCPDPTLLISNNDRVIVEADRGSDLGTVIFDQLTPLDVREWQERQATAALLSGASQHMPPGMAVGGIGAGAGSERPEAPEGTGARVKEGELKGADLAQLLSGCGPSGNAFDSGVGMVQRGPLAKEIMPKRIFAKSAQGPDEQARMIDKRRDEYDAMMICREKVIERGLPMQIVDAEYQWDRRKLTFYFKADRRVDFRELTKENFRIFKSRIWMSMVGRDVDPR
ncbi:uncharacterized protein MKK02DRAFT_32302 [Dioszegia hungarica]|uniref:PSP1 C-terminal domain-containing protein n=1 Tax=Dioszegia hungarica TaxID=4972 RepID=A0AA38HEK7_9TREE|nr:uncharacterized protein MKK02DRAFT_32302 [Dioszegia hungarica]KAI9637464.1 hypothetical protein MKK02DRAFT_32302 [Dioszegia hungarica]